MCHCYDVCPWDRCWRSTNWPQLPAVHISREVCMYDIDYVHTFPFNTPTQQDTSTSTYTMSHIIYTNIRRYINAHVHTCKGTNAHLDTYTCMLTNLQSSIHTTTLINVRKMWTPKGIKGNPIARYIADKHTSIGANNPGNEHLVQVSRKVGNLSRITTYVQSRKLTIIGYTTFT